MENNSGTKKLVTLGLLTAIMLIMSFTPLGYLKIGLLEITFNTIPVAIAAIALGAGGGAVIGGIFGLTSFFQCIGIGGSSPLGVILFGINPVLTFILCLVPRVLVGILAGLIFSFVERRMSKGVSCALAGFFTAFLNTLLFMSLLVIFFGSTEYMRGLIGGRNIIVFVCSFVGINAVFEMLASTVITSAVGQALFRLRLVHRR